TGFIDYERIKAVGPDRAAAEWLLRCGAKVRFRGFDQAIDATESCIMYRGFDHLEGLEHVEEIGFNKCIYIEDACLEHLSQIKTLQDSLKNMTVVSCGNVTDKGIIALHHLSDLPGVKDKDQTVDRLQTALPRLTVELDLA
uniref:Distal membrane arm assembly complex 2 like n=1 Tax=Sinocyclocheilus anshuiensis TaxID=1608454 RepID=A0A671KEK4_9TELE